jgi:hypothetical protein
VPSTAFKYDKSVWKIYGDDVGSANLKRWAPYFCERWVDLQDKGPNYFREKYESEPPTYPAGMAEYFRLIWHLELKRTDTFVYYKPYSAYSVPSRIDGSLTHRGFKFLKTYFVKMKINGETRIVPYRPTTDVWFRAVKSSHEIHGSIDWLVRWKALAMTTFGTNATAHKLLQMMYERMCTALFERDQTYTVVEIENMVARVLASPHNDSEEMHYWLGRLERVGATTELLTMKGFPTRTEVFGLYKLDPDELRYRRACLRRKNPTYTELMLLGEL